MKHIRRISGMAVLSLSLGACSSLGLGGQSGGSNSSAQSGGTSMVQEIMDLEAALASERQRADNAEDDARRASEEANWLAEAAQGVPEMETHIAGLEEQLRAEQEGRIELKEQLAFLTGEVARLEHVEQMRQAAAREAVESVRQEAERIAAAQNASKSTETPLSGNMADETGVYGLHIASYRSREELVRGWAYLRDAHGEILGELSGKSLLFDVPTLGGTYFRLIVGPVTGGRNAQELCDALSGRGEYCVVSEFDAASEDVE